MNPIAAPPAANTPDPKNIANWPEPKTPDELVAIVKEIKRQMGFPLTFWSGIPSTTEYKKLEESLKKFTAMKFETV